MLAGIQLLTGGWSLTGRLQADNDYTYMETWQEYYHGKTPRILKYDTLARSKEDCLYLSGTKHEETQPCHLAIQKPEICGTQCRLEYGNPCTRFCPARVYEMEEAGGQFKLKINPGNCLHCKACDIRDPYGIIRWTCPEGGGGPHYVAM
jgi:electron-transferring-flavoprotein dehydrogenase